MLGAHLACYSYERHAGEPGRGRAHEHIAAEEGECQVSSFRLMVARGCTSHCPAPLGPRPAKGRAMKNQERAYT